MLGRFGASASGKGGWGAGGTHISATTMAMKAAIVTLVLYILIVSNQSVNSSLPVERHLKRKTTHSRTIFFSVPVALPMLPSASSSVSLALANCAPWPRRLSSTLLPIASDSAARRAERSRRASEDLSWDVAARRRVRWPSAAE